MIQIKLDAQILGDKEMRQKLGRLDHKGLPKALDRTLSATKRATGQSISTEVRKRYTLKAAKIKASTKRPIQTADSIKFFTTQKTHTLHSFRGRPSSKGYRASVVKGQFFTVARGFTRKKIDPKGTPFIRVGKARTPIKALQGPSLYKIITKGQRSGPIKKAILQTGKNAFIKNLRRNILKAAEGY